jgi:hypothetical protein
MPELHPKADLLRRLAAKKQLKDQKAAEKASREVWLYLGGITALPILLFVGCSLLPSSSNEPTSAQASCTRQGVTCDEDGDPVGMSKESKDILKDMREK